MSAPGRRSGELGELTDFERDVPTVTRTGDAVLGPIDADVHQAQVVVDGERRPEVAACVRLDGGQSDATAARHYYGAGDVSVAAKVRAPDVNFLVRVLAPGRNGQAGSSVGAGWPQR